MILKKGMNILFEGDSITDACRDRADKHSLAGYTAYVAEALVEEGVECFNRGVSGNRSCDLLARFEESIREVRPDLVSILIGINDVWRRFDENNPTSPEEFERNVRAILEIAKKHAGQIVILEPFLFPVAPEKECFREDLDPKIAKLRKLAREYATDYIPLDGLFAEAYLHVAPQSFSTDGVHPIENGHRFIADEWLARADFE